VMCRKCAENKPVQSIPCRKKEQPIAAGKAAKSRELHRRLDYILANYPEQYGDVDIERALNEAYQTTLELTFEKNHVRRRNVKPAEANRLLFLFKPGIVLRVSDIARINDPAEPLALDTAGEVVFAPIAGGRTETHILFELQSVPNPGKYDYEYNSATLILTYREPWDDKVLSQVAEQRIPVEKDEKGWHFVCLMGEQRHFTESLYAGANYFVCRDCFPDADQRTKIDEHRKQQTVAFLNVTKSEEAEKE
jgi:hypothetical protein